jgi:hypothetical protein
MILIVLRELYLSLSLRRDERNIGGHKKKGEVLRDYWRRKSSTSLSI